MRFSVSKVVISILMIFAGYTQIRACVCEIVPHRTDFRRAVAVFTGTVSSVQNLSPPEDILAMQPQQTRHVSLVVGKRYKGAKTATEELWSYEIPLSCGGFQFQVGKGYLLYVKRAHGGSRYVPTACSPSGQLIARDDWLEARLIDLDKWTFRFWSRIWPF